MTTSSSSPGSLLPRVALSLLLCGGMAAAFLAPGSESSGSPAAAPSPPPEAPAVAPAEPRPRTFPRTGPPGEFPAEAARRLRALADAGEGASLTASGRVLRGKRVSEEDWALFDPDPATYGQRLMALPDYRELLAWVLRGGDMAEAPATARADLEAVDEAYLAAGLLPPFEPYLLARPGAGGKLEHPRWGKFHVPRFEAGPWGWSAAEALRPALEFNGGFEAGLVKDPGGTLGLPGAQASSFMAILDHHGVLLGMLPDPVRRQAVAATARRAVRDYRIGMARAGRSLRREPESADRLSYHLGIAATRCAALHYTEVADMSVEQVLGITARSAAEVALAGDIFREINFGYQALGREVGPRLRREQELWRLAATGTEVGRWAIARARRARTRFIEASLRLGDHVALAGWIDRFDPLLRRRPMVFGRTALIELAAAVLPRSPERMPPYTPAHRETLERALRKLLKKHPDDPERARFERWLAGPEDTEGGQG